MIVHEVRRFAEATQPYYPIDTAKDRRSCCAVEELAKAEPWCCSATGSAHLQYLDIHMAAIGSALSMFDDEG